MRNYKAGFLPTFVWPFLLLLAAAAILLLSAAEPPGAIAPVPPQLYSSAFQLLGTGNRLGTYYPTGQALTEWFNDNLESNNGKGGIFKAIETNGSVDNVRLLKEKKILLGMVESRIAKEQCADPASVSLRLVWPLWPDVVHILQAPANKIPGKPVFPGNGRNYYGQKGSSTYRTSMEILDALGLQDSRAYPAIVPDDVMQALVQGQISYATIQAGMPNRTVSDALIFQGCSLVSLDEELLSKVVAHVQTSRPIAIPGGFYGENQPQVNSIGLANVLVAREDAPEQLIEKVAELLVKASIHLKMRHQALADIPTDPGVAKQIMSEVGIPLHQGTINYLQNKLIAKDVEEIKY